MSSSDIPLLFLLLFVSILPCLTSHKKEQMRLGTFNFQMLFHFAASTRSRRPITMSYAKDTEKDLVNSSPHPTLSFSSFSSHRMTAASLFLVLSNRRSLRWAQFHPILRSSMRKKIDLRRSEAGICWDIVSINGRSSNYASSQKQVSSPFLTSFCIPF